MNERPELNPDTYTFDPSLVSSLTVGSVRAAKEAPDALLSGIPQLDDHYVMFRPKRVTGLLAYTSNGKTSVMNLLARNFVSQLRPDEIILPVTWEDSIEDLTLSYLSSVSKVPMTSLFSGKLEPRQWDAMMQAATARAAAPIWVMGHSEQSESRRPQLTMTDVQRGMEYIVDKRKKKIRVVFLDYLQRISRDDRQGQIREQYMSIMDTVKNLALAFGCTVIIGSQVGRDVKERKWKQPQDHDAQETSNFEQTCDGLISLWIPKKTEPMDAKLINAGVDDKGNRTEQINVTENLMLIQTLKQKKAKAPVLRAVDFCPERNEIGKYTYGMSSRLP